ncbi:MAG: site-specific integrase [Pseudonocardia sp.]|nr:site-specific integrase [Pseudonocardia sp.]
MSSADRDITAGEATLVGSTSRAARRRRFGEPAGWQDWLTTQAEGGWREPEWAQRWWLFTGDPDNPATAASRCRTTACPIMVATGRGRFCRGCEAQRRESGLDSDTFAATFVPQVHRIGGPRPHCEVERAGQRCTGVVSARGLCCQHSNQWRAYRYQRAGRLSMPQWVSQVAIPRTAVVPDCLVGGCLGAAMNARGLCEYHWKRWREDLAAAPAGAGERSASGWAVGRTPFLGAHQFSLLPLPELLRWEMLGALQRRDRIGRVLNPSHLRAVVKGLARAGATSLLDEGLDTTALVPGPVGSRGTAGLRRGLVEELVWAARTSFAEFRGADPVATGVLDLRMSGVRSDYTANRRRKIGGRAELASIEQVWLRRVLVDWAELEHPKSSVFSQTLKAVRFTSQALAVRPGGGHNPAALRFTDMSAVVAHIWDQTKPDGTPYSPGTPRNWVWLVFRLLDYASRAGLCDALAASFVQDRSAHFRRDEPNEDELGKAIPEPVIAQLDAHIDRLGRAATSGPVPGTSLLDGEDLAALYRTAYLLLRDTGRRPNEITGLPRDCLEQRGDNVSLIWNNHKAGRLRRRLPITGDTAQIIRDWQARRDRIVDRHPGSDRFLFPALSADTREQHFPNHSLWLGIRRWVDAIPDLVDDGVDHLGNRLPFDRARIYPYAFRHSYAQRHADNGTDIDVLRELMDHLSVQTTGGYYTVSLDRRRAAVTTLAAQVIDRTGAPTPCSPGAYELRSVAVPYGGCTEPSNVKAGGKACPIRFQCAGCGFYRPDPSYLTAIEQHLNELRAGRETATATGAAPFVVTALTEEIGAYEAVAATMRTRLAELPDDERAEIEHASTLLRRIRAGTPLPLTVRDKTDDPTDDTADDDQTGGAA